ncbi:MAG: SH3 beta-barrel fold-containing protein [Gammaproteobacteria bacterium]|nr:SH3 beta-barrel fold-containing protein [Gammaproteobacteria bacterium]
MNKESLLERLESTVSFSFIKKDGTLRVVEKATTNLDLIPESDRPSGKRDQTKKRENNPNLISFYDFGVKAWRSCQADQLVEIID